MRGQTSTPKDSRRNTQLADRGQPKALVTDLSWAGIMYQVDKTQSTRFEVSKSDQNKGKMSSEVEPDTNTLILTTVAEIQALIGDSRGSSKMIVMKNCLRLERKWMKNSFTNKDQPELSKAKKTDASDSESSSCSETFKPYDNYMPITKRQLYEEVAASYADLKWSINDFHAATIRHYENTNVVLINYRHIITLFKTDHNTCIQRILDNLQEVHNAVKEDTALNKKVLEAVEAYIKNSTNLTELLTLVKNFDFPGLNTTIDSLQAVITTQNDHLAK
ncbi:hypothetical protein Tco_0674969 [Tanacetum coccineum]